MMRLDSPMECEPPHWRWLFTVGADARVSEMARDQSFFCALQRVSSLTGPLDGCTFCIVKTCARAALAAPGVSISGVFICGAATAVLAAPIARRKPLREILGKFAGP